MSVFKLITLIDITQSNAARTETDRIKVGQRSNYNSLTQAIGLRSNFEFWYDPKMETGRLPEPADGKATYWTWEIETERDYVFDKNGDPVGLLVDDLHGVPVIVDLLNSVDITPAAFQTKGNNVNTWITIIS